MKHILFLKILLFLSFKVLAQQPADSIKKTINNQNYVLDRVASYPKGEYELGKFILQKIDHLVPEQNGAPAGRYKVIIDFVVDKEGNIKDMKPITSYGYGMEEEAMRVIHKSAPWQPSIQEGKAINTKMRLPITFKVELKGVIISNSSHEKYLLYEGVENELAFTPIYIKEKDLIISIDRGVLKNMDKKNKRKNIYIDEPGKPVIMTITTEDGYLEKVYFEVLPEKRAPIWLKRIQR